MKMKISVLLLSLIIATNSFGENVKKANRDGYDQVSRDFNSQQIKEKQKKLDIDREIESENANEEKTISSLSLKIADKEKHDYWIIRPQARNLFMAIEKNILIGEIKKADKLLEELKNFIDLPGSDMAELAVYNVANYLVLKEYGEDIKAKISCVRAIKITEKKELFDTQKLNYYLTNIFCNEYLGDFVSTKGQLIHRQKTSYEYVLTHLKEENISQHIRYIKLMNYLNDFESSDMSFFISVFKAHKSRLVSMYGIQSVEKANYLLKAGKFMMTKWQEREETLFIFKTGYKMLVKLLRQKYEKNPNNNLLVGKFLMNIAGNYYGSISYKQSIPYYEKAAEIFKKNGFDYYLVEALKNLSYVYRLSRDVDKALKTVTVTLKEAERVYGKESVEYGSILIIEADIFNIDKDYSNSIRDLQEAKRIFSEKYGQYSNKVKLINLNIKYVELDEEAAF